MTNPENIFGYSFQQIQAMQRKEFVHARVKLDVAGDYGADPLGDGTFRMVPSGDIVDFKERCKRLEGN